MMWFESQNYMFESQVDICLSLRMMFESQNDMFKIMQFESQMHVV